MLDQPSFETRKGWEEALTVTEMEGHPWPCILPETRAPPVTVSAWGAKGCAKATCQVHIAQRRVRQSFRIYVLAPEDTAFPVITSEQDALIRVWLVTLGDSRPLRVLRLSKSRRMSGACGRQHECKDYQHGNAA
jgi:hypothetical protein